MKKVLRHQEILIYSILSLVLVILALTINYKNPSLVGILTQPFILLGDGIREIGNSFGGYFLYILIGLLPLVFSVVRAIIKKKVYYQDLLWLVLSAFTYLALYFFINPHLFSSIIKIDGFEGLLQEVNLNGLALIFYSLLILALFFELYQSQKKDHQKGFTYLKLFLRIIIIVTLVKVFFLELISLKTQLQVLTKNQDLIIDYQIDPNLNIFIILFNYLLSLIPALFSLYLYYKVKNFIDQLQVDMFAITHIENLNKINKSCLITILLSITGPILANIITLIFSGKLLSLSYTLTLPTIILITSCLIFILNKVLIKAIKINEENKLTI